MDRSVADQKLVRRPHCSGVTAGAGWQDSQGTWPAPTVSLDIKDSCFTSAVYSKNGPVSNSSRSTPDTRPRPVRSAVPLTPRAGAETRTSAAVTGCLLTPTTTSPECSETSCAGNYRQSDAHLEPRRLLKLYSKNSNVLRIAPSRWRDTKAAE